ncbi:MAG: hypothetical protein K2W96_23665, partial [Gemmataceae bacterium]|nr:hypothetical protein [Gemmataceae bacterium]
MSVCLGFFRFVARAAFDCVGFGPAGDFLSEVVPEMARKVFGSWRAKRPSEQAHADLQAIADLPHDEARRLAEQAIELELAAAPADLKLSLIDYLTRVPSTVRRTVRPGLVIGRPLDVEALLPPRLPRFRAGDPAPGFPSWTLETLLGEGGFGEVWRAAHAYLPPVALKYCLDPAAARTLRNEAGLLGRIVRHGRHEGLVALIDTALESDPPCLKYELAEGGDLAGVIGRGPAPRRDAQALVRRLAETLAHLHRLSPPIVHR